MDTSASSESEFAAAIKAGRWPEADPEDWLRLKDFHESRAAALNEAADNSRSVYRPRMAESLVGAAGEAQLAAHDHSLTLWHAHADRHKARAAIAGNNYDYLSGLRLELLANIEAGEPLYYQAVRTGDATFAATILSSHIAEAESSVTFAVSGITGQARQATGDTQALDNTTDSGRAADKDTKQTGIDDGQLSNTEGGDPRTTRTGSTAKQAGVSSEGAGQDGDDPLPEPVGKQDDVAPSPHAPQQLVPQPQTQPQYPPVSMPMSPAGMGGGGSGGSGLGSGSMNSGLGGLSSAARPPISPSSVPTAPASSSATPAASPISQAAKGFESGLSSGMGSSGALPPTAFQQALQPLPPEQAMPVTSEPPGGSAATPAASAPGAVAPAHQAPAPALGGGGPGGGGPLGGGGAMMPPPVAGSTTPLAPYSPPGAGVAPSAPTAPAGVPAPTGGAGAPASAGAGPLFAGPAGAVGAAGASSLTAANPDLLAAQRILAALVKACPQRPMFWAVSVLRSPLGPQTVIANSAGGGGYLPQEVRLPTNVQLAVLDPALPSDWAATWMGWQSPSAILVDHFERLRYQVAGLRVWRLPPRSYGRGAQTAVATSPG